MKLIIVRSGIKGKRRTRNTETIMLFAKQCINRKKKGTRFIIDHVYHLQQIFSALSCIFYIFFSTFIELKYILKCLRQLS